MSIDALADVRQPVADLDAALAVLLEADLQRIELVALLAVGVVDDDDACEWRASSGSCTSANGVSAIVLPAYLVSIGLGSKLSRWLTPPFMNSQMTLLAFGAKCGWPSGGAQSAIRRRNRRAGAWRRGRGR